jgi:hypothetical protein
MRRVVALLVVGCVVLGSAFATDYVKVAQNLCFDSKKPFQQLLKEHPGVLQKTIQWQAVSFYDGSMGAQVQFQCKGKDWGNDDITVWFEVNIKIMADGKTGMITLIEKTNPYNEDVMQEVIIDKFIDNLVGKGNLALTDVEVSWEY